MTSVEQIECPFVHLGLVLLRSRMRGEVGKKCADSGALIAAMAMTGLPLDRKFVVRSIPFTRNGFLPVSESNPKYQALKPML